MSASYNICLDVGGTKVLGAIFNEKDEIIYRLKKRSKSGGSESAGASELSSLSDPGPVDCVRRLHGG